MSRGRRAPVVQDPNDRFQRETHDIVGALSDSPLLNGVLLRDIELSTTTVRVYHNLGRPALGFIVVDRTADVRVYRDPTFAATPNVAIPLKANTTATVSLWIF